MEGSQRSATRAKDRLIESQLRLKGAEVEFKSIDRTHQHAHKLLSELLDCAGQEGSSIQLTSDIRTASSNCNHWKSKLAAASKKVRETKAEIVIRQAAVEHAERCKRFDQGFKDFDQGFKNFDQHFKRFDQDFKRFEADSKRYHEDFLRKDDLHDEAFEKCKAWQKGVNEETKRQSAAYHKVKVEKNNFYPEPSFAKWSGPEDPKMEAKPKAQQQQPRREQPKPSPKASLLPRPIPKPTPPRKGTKVDPKPSNAAITQYFKQIESAFADYTTLQIFPTPPAWPCGKPACEAAKPRRALASCECNIKYLFQDRESLKADRLKFHPDKFSRCPEGVKESFQAMAKEVFVIVDGLWQAQQK